MATDNRKNDGVNLNINADAWAESKAYRCHVLLIQEEDGTFSGVVMNLPGAGSCGDTEEETLANVREAVRGVIESYGADGKDIPWQDSSGRDMPAGAKQQWILVDA
jgi:predicted RNase H-like HicB family nuclease